MPDDPTQKDGLLELFGRLLAARKTGEALDILVQGTIELLNAETGYLVRKHGEHVVFYRSWGSRPDGTTEAVSKAIVETALTCGEPLLVGDVPNSEFGLRASVRLHGLRSVLASRVDAGEPVALYLESSSRTMGADDLELFRKIVEMADGVLVENTERLAREHAPTLDERHDLAGIVAKDPAMVGVLQRAMQMARTEYPVLVQGANGTGKEVVVKAIHRNSPRRDRPLEIVNCAAIPPTLFESTLFGHARGAFTGATGSGNGILRRADGGTVLLDEIGELPLEMQVKILRTLQNGEIQPVGLASSLRVDIRFMAATNMNLPAAVQRGAFREDLYYRLEVLKIEVPPLTRRPLDILPLFFHFLEAASQELEVGKPDVSEEAQAALERQPWPGNVRQLKNEALRLVAMHGGGQVGLVELSLPESSAPALANGLDDSARELIQVHLKAANGNRSEAARTLGISREGLRLKMKRLKIDFP